MHMQLHANDAHVCVACKGMYPAGLLLKCMYATVFSPKSSGVASKVVLSQVMAVQDPDGTVMLSQL